MGASKFINLNDYTLLSYSANEEIRFYPEADILKQKVTKHTDTLYIKFEVDKENTDGLYFMYVTLYDSENNELYKSYSIYLKEISLYKYIILNSQNDFADAEIMPSLIIDFNKLSYNNFLNILSSNKDLSRMIPEFKRALEEDIETINEAKTIAENINIQSPLNYYQNITGYLINEIESIVANDDEMDISRSILKKFKKNYELVLKDSNQIKLSNLALMAKYLDQIRSNNLQPKNILDASILKTDTNKESISYKDLTNILNRLVEREKENKPLPDDLNIIQERIVYLIESKPKIKEFKGLLKIILASDKYLSNNKRIRAVDERKLKELLLKILTKLTYRTLPRGQILIYNLEESVDFVAIVSMDKIVELLDTYYINRNTDKNVIELYKKSNELVKSDEPVKKDERYFELLINNIINMNVYYYKNISNTILLFSNGEAVIDLDYKEGSYDISIVNKITSKKMASLSKIADETKEEIKFHLNKDEKSFIAFINKIVYQNLISDLINQSIEVIIKEYTHNGITIKFNKSQRNDIFTGEFTLGDFLKIFSSVKELQKKNKKIDIEEVEIPEEEEEPTEPVEEEQGLKQEEIDQIIRKASAIAEVMNSRPIDNNQYKIIAGLYNEYRKTKNEDLLPTLKEELEKK